MLGLSRADVVIGPWMDASMDNLVFLLPGTAVLEIIPPDVFADDRLEAKEEARCLDLKYDQVHATACLCSLPPSLTWPSVSAWAR